jgi:hypothetical protein
MADNLSVTSPQKASVVEVLLLRDAEISFWDSAAFLVQLNAIMRA